MQRIKPLKISRSPVKYQESPEKILNSLRKLENVFQFTKLGIGTGSLDGTIEMVNPAFARMHGYRPEDLVGKPVVMLFAEEERRYLPRIMEKIHKEGLYYFESKHVRKDGSIFPVLVEAITIYQDGQPQYRVINLEDITERKLAQEKLVESEKRYRTLFHKANDAIVLCEFKENGDLGKFIEVNKTACQLYGYSRDEFKQLTVRDILCAESQKQLLDWLGDLKAKRKITIEATHLTKEGKLIPSEVNCLTFRLRGKKVLLAAIRDLSIRFEALRNLSESEERFRGIIEHSSNGIVLCDEEGIIRVWNYGMKTITGIKAEKVLGQFIWDVAYDQLNDDQRIIKEYKELKMVMLKIFGTGEIPPHIQKREIEIINTENQKKIIQYLSFPIPTAKGYKWGIVFNDITTEKALEEEIKQQNEELKRMDSLKNQFLTNISHDLRTPLTCLSTFSEILKDTLKDKADDRQTLCLKEIEHNVRRLLTEVDSLLVLSRIEIDRLPIKREMVNLKEQMYSVIKDMRPLFKQKNTRLIINIGKIPDISLDPRAFGQIITNLLNNAVKNTPPGGMVTIKAQYSKGELFCSVADQGSGIDSDNLQHVFENYYYAPQEDAQAAGGTGLGLTLCQELVTILGGRIWVENNPERGSTFCFIITDR